jgi:FKBP-type peptidyl-prolyl cis-trans isomerase
MMRKGEKAFIVSPPELAYGANGIPELVPPNATLIYNLELMEIK